MERLLRATALDISSRIRVEAVLGDGAKAGASALFEADWEPRHPETVLLIERLVGMEADRFRQWREERGSGAREAIEARVVGTFYRGTVDATAEPSTIVAWLERFGDRDPYLGEVRVSMDGLGITPDQMRTVCSEEFGVSRYELLSLADREQLVALLREPDAAEWLRALLAAESPE